MNFRYRALSPVDDRRLLFAANVLLAIGPNDCVSAALTPGHVFTSARR